jgi:hypothetical protein
MRHELEKAGTAFFMEGAPEQDAVDLSKWLTGGRTVTRSPYADRYTARRQVAEFAALFDQLMLSEKGSQ